MNNVIEAAKAEITRANHRIIKCLEKTPDDKLNWSPSPTARTPIQLVAHAAFGVNGLMGIVKGEPMGFENVEALDEALRVQEKTFTTRDQAVGLLEENTKTYFAWLDTLSEEEINSTVELPFGVMPLGIAITIVADHTRSHCSQLEYLQTIWGDHDWYM